MKEHVLATVDTHYPSRGPVKAELRFCWVCGCHQEVSFYGPYPHPSRAWRAPNGYYDEGAYKVKVQYSTSGIGGPWESDSPRCVRSKEGLCR